MRVANENVNRAGKSGNLSSTAARAELADSSEGGAKASWGAFSQAQQLLDSFSLIQGAAVESLWA